MQYNNIYKCLVIKIMHSTDKNKYKMLPQLLWIRIWTFSIPSRKMQICIKFDLVVYFKLKNKLERDFDLQAQYLY